MDSNTAGLSELRSRIQKAFAAEPYRGKITPVDDQLGEEFDDDRILRRELINKRWIDVPLSFIRQHASDLVLLTDDAFVSFVPAWLMAALDDFESENVVRDQVVFAFSPKPDLIPNMSESIANRIRILSKQQRDVVRRFLSQCAASDVSDFVRKHAADAAEFVASIPDS